MKIACGGSAQRADIGLAQGGQHFVQDAQRLQPPLPLSFGAEQVFFGDHFQDRPDVLGHAAVYQQQTFLQFAPRLRRGSLRVENAMAGH